MNIGDKVKVKIDFNGFVKTPQAFSQYKNIIGTIVGFDDCNVVYIFFPGIGFYDRWNIDFLELADIEKVCKIGKTNDK